MASNGIKLQFFIGLRDQPTRQAADQAVERPLAGRAAAEVIVDPLGFCAVELITEEPP
jgi:hypothetical protein